MLPTEPGTSTVCVKSTSDVPRVTPLWGMQPTFWAQGCSPRGLGQSGEVGTCGERSQSRATEGWSWRDIRLDGVVGLAQEFRGKKFVLSPTGTGEPPAGHKQGVT